MKKKKQNSHWIVPDNLRSHADLLQTVDFFSARASIDYVLAARDIIRCYPELMNIIDMHEMDINQFRAVKELVSMSRRTARAIDTQDSIGVDDRETFANIPAGNTIYYRTSTALLKEKISGTRNTKTYSHHSDSERYVSAVKSLQEIFNRNVSSLNLNKYIYHNSLENLSQLIIIAFGFDDISALQSNYAEYFQESRVLRSDFHDKNNVFFYGPYIDIAPGKYQLELMLNTSHQLDVKISIMRTGDGNSVNIHTEQKRLTVGNNTFHIKFEWLHKNNASLYESVLRVNESVFASLELQNYKLTYLS